MANRENKLYPKHKRVRSTYPESRVARLFEINAVCRDPANIGVLSLLRHVLLTLHDRISGSLLAGALGDSIGAHFENQTTPQFALPPYLRITDDTQLTLATCESIIECGCIDPESIADQMATWFRDRRITGIGASTLKSLTELAAGGHWALVGATGERTAGNGAAMRISPLAFFLDPNDESDRRTIRDVSRITHRNDEAYLGALAMIFTINETKLDRSMIDLLIDKLPDSRIRDRFIEIDRNELDARNVARKYSPSGYVVDSVPFSILAAIESNNLLESFQLIIECGGDTDTTASMYGNIFGAFHGIDIIPINIASQIDAYSTVVETAAKLSRVANAG